MKVFIRGLVPKTTLNSREHWAPKSRRAKKEREAAYAALLAAGSPWFDHVVVVITRRSPRRLDDDNATAAMKSVRDGVADWLRIDDGCERIRWVVEQAKVSGRDAGTMIEIMEAN